MLSREYPLLHKLLQPWVRRFIPYIIRHIRAAVRYNGFCWWWQERYKRLFVAGSFGAISFLYSLQAFSRSSGTLLQQFYPLSLRWHRWNSSGGVSNNMHASAWWRHTRHLSASPTHTPIDPRSKSAHARWRFTRLHGRARAWDHRIKMPWIKSQLTNHMPDPHWQQSWHVYKMRVFCTVQTASNVSWQASSSSSSSSPPHPRAQMAPFLMKVNGDWTLRHCACVSTEMTEEQTVQQDVKVLGMFKPDCTRG